MPNSDRNTIQAVFKISLLKFLIYGIMVLQTAIFFVLNAIFPLGGNKQPLSGGGTEIIMIGLGKWSCTVKTIFFSGEVKLHIFDNNGSYGFELLEPKIDLPDITVKEITENGNTVDVVIQTSMLPGKDIELHAEFDGDFFSGHVKIPVMGKVKLNNGHRITE